jgi:hypothetical protein
MMNPGEDAVARSHWLNWLPVLGAGFALRGAVMWERQP